MQDQHKLAEIYRPYPSGTIRALLHVRSAGHYITGPGWSDGYARKEFLELFWGVRGEGEFRLNGTSWILKPGEVCFYFPGEIHDLTRRTPLWEYYWLTIDGENLPDLIRGFDLKRESRFAGSCPVDLFENLMKEIRSCSRRGEFCAGAEAYKILSLAMAGSDTANRELCDAFQKLVRETYNDPDVTVEWMSRELQVHRSTLHRIVSEHFGCPPQEFLISYRIQSALRLLYETRARIKEIAEATGFRDQNYFTKALLHRLGKTPSGLRRERGFFRNPDAALPAEKLKATEPPSGTDAERAGAAF